MHVPSTRKKKKEEGSIDQASKFDFRSDRSNKRRFGFSSKVESPVLFIGDSPLLRSASDYRPKKLVSRMAR